MKLVLSIILFLAHLALSAILINFVGEWMSQQINILLVLLLGLVLSAIMISIIYHVKHLYFVIKKHI